jgi:solute carrier family 25 carnitine/acylcarnitine transporter 20/29
VSPCYRLIILLQGTLTPLLGTGVCVSIQFGVLEYTKRYFAGRNLANGQGGMGGKDLSAGQLLVAGVLAGLANGVVSGPVEHIRIRKPFDLFHIHEKMNSNDLTNRPTDSIRQEPDI